MGAGFQILRPLSMSILPGAGSWPEGPCQDSADFWGQDLLHRAGDEDRLGGLLMVLRQEG